MADEDKKPKREWVEEEEEGALFPSAGESPLFEGPDILHPHEIQALKEAEKVEAIVQDDTLDEPAKIDAIAKVRNWFIGPTETIDAFLAGDNDTETAVTKLAAPIEKAYSTADYGRAYYYAEMTARSQRSIDSSEKALELWGPEEDWPEPSLPANETGTDTDTSSTEGHLWSLWYGILHAAKRIPWTDTVEQERLLALVQALKQRPDPPAPSPMTIPLKRNWIWETGTLWSTLSMLGPSAREAWNDCCGCGAGWTVPEQHAWTNVNAFVARLVASGASGALAVYGDWAVGEAVENRPREEGPPARTQMTVRITVACVWLQIAGRYMWNLRTDEGVSPDLRVADLGARENKLPWYGRKKGAEKARRCSVRWDFWRRRLEQEAQNGELGEEVRELARGSAEIIGKFFEGY